MNSSDGVAILVHEASFDSGAGGGDAGGTSVPPNVLICQKSGQNLWKYRKNPAKFGHGCFDTFVLTVWWMSLTVEIRLILTFFFSIIHMKTFYVWLPKKVLIIFVAQIFRVSLSKFEQKSFAPPKICLPLYLVVSRPIFASLRLEDFRSRLSLEAYVPACS